jgi:hypothetical protein
MLSRYGGKTIRLTTNDGEVFIGKADTYPSGYGLYTFGVEEESVCINGTFIFLSQIARIEPPEGFTVTDGDRKLYDTLTTELLEQPYRTVGCLPQPVPNDAAGQAFMVEQYFRQMPQLSVLRRKQAKILLRLNCYCDMAVTTDGGESWEKNPDPEQFVKTVDALSGDSFLRVLFPSQSVMIELDGHDTQMTVVCPDSAVETIRRIAEAEGLFLWKPQTDNK